MLRRSKRCIVIYKTWFPVIDSLDSSILNASPLFLKPLTLPKSQNKVTSSNTKWLIRGMLYVTHIHPWYKPTDYKLEMLV